MGRPTGKGDNGRTGKRKPPYFVCNPASAEPWKLTPHRHYSARRTPRLAPCLLALALSGCSSSSPNEPAALPEFEGTYAITGTFAPCTTPNTGLFGSHVITSQNGTTATAAVAVKLLDNGHTSFALNTPDPGVSATVSPGQAQLKSDGSFSLELSGREDSPVSTRRRVASSN